MLVTVLTIFLTAVYLLTALTDKKEITATEFITACNNVYGAGNWQVSRVNLSWHCIEKNNLTVPHFPHTEIKYNITNKE